MRFRLSMPCRRNEVSPPHEDERRTAGIHRLEEGSLQTLTKARDVFFVLLGVAGLLLKQRYSGPWEELLHSYGGNVTVSFAVYFLLARLHIPSRHKKLVVAAIALAAVELFEISDGFGLMSNVYDRFDLAANALGVALAAAVDVFTSLRPVPPARWRRRARQRRGHARPEAAGR